MGKITGFLDFEREDANERDCAERLGDYAPFYENLSRESREIQASRCMNCGVPFCQVAVNLGANPNDGKSGDNKSAVGCPLGNLIPEWNDLLSKGFWREAYERLAKTSPFSEFTGRVCPAPCEFSCVCGANGAPVTIKNNELSIIENAWESGLITPNTAIKRNGKSVAIIGSGPAGLAAADKLNRLGYQVSVYERSDRLGGLLMYGIPDMKLEKAIVSRRVGLLEKEGVQFFANQNINTKQKADKILKSYHALILATGATKPLDLEIQGRNLGGIMFAMDFLTQSTKALLDSKKPLSTAKGKDVLVIGSGDTSVDCIAVALRQGAKSIMRFERSPKKPLSRTNRWPEPSNALQTDYGIKEAIAKLGYDPRNYEMLTKSFVGKDSRVIGVEAAKLEWRREGENLVRREIPGSTKFYKADLVILAMGFSGSEEAVGESFGVNLDQNGNIAASGYQTNNPRIFACGDARRGQSLVVWALKDALECAAAVDKALR